MLPWPKNKFEAGPAAYEVVNCGVEVCYKYVYGCKCCELKNVI